MFKGIRKKVMLKTAEVGMRITEGLMNGIMEMCITSYRCGRADCKDITYDEAKHREQVKNYINNTLMPAFEKAFERDMKG